MWRGESTRGLAFLLVLVATSSVACNPDGLGAVSPAAGRDSTASNPAAGTGSDPTLPDGNVSATGTVDGGASAQPGCDIPAGEPFSRGQSVELAYLGDVNGTRVSGAVYPHPDYEGNPWSQWGQGIATGDGRFFSAIGDHLARDGNSYVYEYDRSSNTLTMVGDILSYVDHVPGTWGYGKIHSQMVPGPCGEIYFSTYWGSFRDLQFEGDYTGDIIFRLDPLGETLQPLGVPVQFHGQASMAAAPDFSILYGEAADPLTEATSGPFFAYDVAREEVIFTGPARPHVGYRSILVDANGVAYYSIGQRRLEKYDPASGESVTHEAMLPGEWLRATTSPGPDGSVYGVTRDPDTFFVMHPDGSIERIGDALGYTASMALSPDGSTFYYMPGAHGDSAEWGSPLVAVDTSTGEETIVAELYDLVEENLGYRLGGSYDVAVAPDGGTVFLGVNVGDLGSDESFGEVALLVVALP